MPLAGTAAGALGRHRRRRRFLGTIVATGVGVAVALGPAVGAASATARRPAAVGPLPSSLTTSAGTWAAVPMGHLHQRLTTYWQLFFLPDGSERWRDDVSALAVGTNGGLLLATPDGRSLVVAVRPANRLRFSALVGTTSGSSWNPIAPVDGAIDSLSVGADGQRLALVAGSSGGRVVAGDAGSTWHVLVSGRTLRRAPAARSCSPRALSAVGSLAGVSPVVGASCGNAGTVGLFAEEAGTWRSIGPAHISSAQHTEVLSIGATSGTPTVLLNTATHWATGIEATWPAADGSWERSSKLSLGRHGHLVSVGAVPGGGEFVVYSTSARSLHLATIGGPGTRWVHLPDPPRGTATVAFPRPGRVDALSVADTTMTDWVLRTGTAAWTRHQVVHVKILFGSAS